MAELPYGQDLCLEQELAGIHAAADPAVCEEAGGPTSVELVVLKSGPQDKLGMDVKHVRGRLVIKTVVPGGAVDRANRISRSRKPPGDVIGVGDVISQVNDIQEIDTAMVAECQQKAVLRIRAVRRR